MKRILTSSFLALLTLLLPCLGRAEESAQTAKTVFHIDVSAFLDSLQYMLKGMVGIFLVTGIIILAVVILEKATKKKEE